MFSTKSLSLLSALALCALAITLNPGTAEARYRPFKCPTANASGTTDIALNDDDGNGYMVSALIDVRMPREAASVKCLFQSWNDARRENYNSSLVALAKKLLWANSDGVFSHETIYGDGTAANTGMDEEALLKVLLASPTRAEWLGSARWHTPHTRGNVPSKFGGGSKAKAKAHEAPAPTPKPEAKAKTEAAAPAPMVEAEAPAPKVEAPKVETHEAKCSDGSPQPCPAPVPEEATPAAK